jgi:VanZ family protein
MFFHGIFLPWIRRAGKVLFWPALAVVMWGELTPHPPELAGPLMWDKLDHFIAYFGLALLSTLAWGLKRSLLWLFLGLVALGGGMEILQALLSRDAEWGDFLANDLGILAGMGLAAAYLAAPRRLVDSPPRD